MTGNAVNGRDEEQINGHSQAANSNQQIIDNGSNVNLNNINVVMPREGNQI